MTRLGDREINRLAEVSVRSVHRRGEFVTRMDTVPAQVYLVVDGEVVLGYDTIDGRAMPLLLFYPGDVCGLALQSARMRAMYHLRVASRTTILHCMPTSSLEALCDWDACFRRHYHALLLDRVADALQRVADLGSLNAEEYLLLHLRKRARLDPGRLVTDTGEELASWLGISRGRVAALLARLYEEGDDRASTERPRHRGQ